MEIPMVKMFGILILATLMSCASKQSDLARLENEVNAEDAKSFENIKNHFILVLNAHPELKQDDRNKISLQLNESINRHITLKENESKVVQLLLRKSIKGDEFSEQDSRDKKSLKERLTNIYESKSDNIFSLVTYIKGVVDGGQVSESFEKDMLFIIRDFR